ncbi:hypothetical protein [Cryobacterium sp. SO1]|uniref:hypothetical protein n=1 Tax=Cryobacterium sp. SO1 TaxID=1897061 RepID=UPI0010DA987F|nr:hypothetical protein [Cryobacterium sp. SO1]RZI36013.1 hypothetical protein BJQ95_01601 [Cryobacterium sp. SO1]
MGGASSPLTAAEVGYFEDVLGRRRRDLLLELSRQGDTLNAVRAARSGGDADDEHDP